MEYLATITPEGKTLIIETYNITNISLLQPIELNDRKGIYYLVIIDYQDGQREQTVISNEVWEYWNQNRNK